MTFPTYVSALASQSSTQSDELSATNAAAQLSDADLALVMAEVFTRTAAIYAENLED